MENKLEGLKSEKRKTILVVENDEATGELLILTISQETKHQAKFTGSANEALRITRSFTPHLFLLDYNLSSMTGIQLYDQLHRTKGLEHVPAVLMSASMERYQSELKRRNIVGLGKPFEIDELLDVIESALSD